MTGQHHLLHGYAPLRVADLIKRAQARTVTWTPDQDDPILDGLDPDQAAGMACVQCGISYLRRAVEHIAVGRSTTGSLVFACIRCPSAPPNAVAPRAEAATTNDRLPARPNCAPVPCRAAIGATARDLTHIHRNTEKK